MSKKGGAKGKQAPSNVFDAKKYERPGLSADEVEEIKEAFDLFDTDQSGAISVSELTSAMKSLGFDVKHAVVFQMIAELDADGSGEIEFEEFLDMMTARISDKNSREDIERVFKLFDSDRTGEVSLENMKRVAKELGEDISPQELQEIVQRADLDGDGALTLDDFYQVMTKKTFA
jgi:centrin-1